MSISTNIPPVERVTVKNKHGKVVSLAKQVVDGNPGAYTLVKESPASTVQVEKPADAKGGK